jgi:phosphoribosyl 1,2-cyclic phosphodiesterase
MQIWTLGTGSRGNALVIDGGGTRLMVDAGFGTRTLRTRLGQAGIAPESIEGLVVTHEHTDHISGAGAAARRWGWRVFATHGTARESQLDPEATTTFSAGETFSVGALDVQTIRSSHDATEPVVLIVVCRPTGARAGIVYDLGRVSRPLASELIDLDMLVLESNHDEEMLVNGPYPRTVQRRIGGAHGHLSNVAAASLAAHCAHRKLKHIALVHLSQNCNLPKLAMKTVGDSLRKTSFAGRLTATTQDGVHGPFAAAGRARNLQLSLAL